MVKPQNIAPKETRHLVPGVAILAMCTAAAQWGTSAVNAALPEMSSWAGNATQAQWAAVAYLLALTSASLVVGYLGDLVGRIWVLEGGLVLFIAASVECALAPGMALLILGRVVQGVGAAAMTVLPLALVRDSVPAGRSGTAMGTLGTAAAVGTASGPALGGLLMGTWGWPAIFWAMLPLPMLVLTLLPGMRAVAIQRSSSDVMVATELTRNHVMIGAVTLNLLVSAIMMSTLVVGPFYLTGALGLGSTAMGVAMAAGPLTSVCVGVLAGRFVDRGEPARLVALGLVLMALAAAALAFLPPLLGLPGYLTGTVLLAPGYQLFMAANNTHVMQSVPAARRGSAAGLLGLSRSIGQVTGASLLASLFALVVGGLVDAPRTDLDAGLRIVFGLLAVILVAAALTALSRAAPRRPRPRVG